MQSCALQNVSSLLLTAADLLATAQLHALPAPSLQDIICGLDMVELSLFEKAASIRSICVHALIGQLMRNIVFLWHIHTFVQC